MNKTVIGILGVVVVIVVAGALVVMHRNSSMTSANATPSSSSSTPAATSTPTSSSQSSSASTSAGTVAVTGGTNGPECDSGGYFKPSSVTVTSGGTVTFSVPASDPYAGGLQINGLPQGAIVVPRGGSMTTSPITSTVSYNGTWPNETSCKKGSGTITVQ